jgi:hypothetical protein
LSTLNTIVNGLFTWRVPNASTFCAAALIFSPHGIKAILIRPIAWNFVTLNLKMIKHFIMVNELRTPGALIDMIRKGNYPIILDVELMDL